ncbi:unnamed protein product [Soboliphyme baturini]|uniref:Transposase n=1 Tax=Soboliphyme baturini TaxID=241478 RepID=A0A183J1Z2_9BILA|nr:unnamed protein product [Soboliphyme baturini]
MVTMTKTKYLYTDNIWFKKTNISWTWIAAIPKTRNEIEFVLFHKCRIIWDTAVVTSCDTGSDHKWVQERLTFKEKIERKALQITIKDIRRGGVPSAHFH